MSLPHFNLHVWNEIRNEIYILILTFEVAPNARHIIAAVSSAAQMTQYLRGHTKSWIKRSIATHFVVVCSVRLRKSALNIFAINRMSNKTNSRAKTAAAKRRKDKDKQNGQVPVGVDKAARVAQSTYAHHFIAYRRIATKAIFKIPDTLRRNARGK